MPNDFVIHIDGKEFKVQSAELTGAALKTLAGKDASFQLFLEEKGRDADLLVKDSDTVPIRNGEHFYTVPPASFGR